MYCLSYLENIQGDLVPPSHFASTVPSAGSQSLVKLSPPMSWLNPVPTAGDLRPANPWLALSQAQQEILELRKENQRIRMLQGNFLRGKTSVDHLPGHTMRYFSLNVFFNEEPNTKSWCKMQICWQKRGELQMGVSREAQGWSREAEGSGGNPEGECTEEQGRDERKRRGPEQVSYLLMSV